MAREESFYSNLKNLQEIKANKNKSNQYPDNKISRFPVSKQA